jgi:hypothetical protein
MNTRLAVASFVLLLAVASVGSAEWINSTTEVPVDRVVANLNRRLRENPEDTKAHYVLARIHSMAYARAAAKLHLEMPGKEDPKGLPGFAPWDSVREKGGRKRKLDAAARDHFHRSVHHYEIAVKLAPDDPLVWLGLGWMMDDGSVHAPALGTPDGVERKSALPADVRARYEKLVLGLAAEDPEERLRCEKALRAELGRAMPVLLARKDSEVADIRLRVGRLLAYAWERRAVEAYRGAWSLAVETDLAQESIGGHGDSAVSLEAGKGLIRLLRKHGPTEEEKAEIARVEKSIEKLTEKPMWITPLVFPVASPAPLRDLVDPEHVVSFDLDGDGVPGRWPWVRASAGILVWNPEGDARVDSGRRLFGSVTWWISWRDGYAPLAALDDDGDGRLAGDELRGIGVWVDANRDGVSDPGEIVPAARCGIVSIAVAARGTHDGVPAHPEGIEMRDGSTRPTYDWTPRRVIATPR